MNNSYLLAGVVVILGGVVLYMATQPAPPTVHTGMEGSSQTARDITSAIQGLLPAAASAINSLRNPTQGSSAWNTVTGGMTQEQAGTFVPDRPVFSASDLGSL